MLDYRERPKSKLHRIHLRSISYRRYSFYVVKRLPRKKTSQLWRPLESQYALFLIGISLIPGDLHYIAGYTVICLPQALISCDDLHHKSYKIYALCNNSLVVKAYSFNSSIKSKSTSSKSAKTRGWAPKPNTNATCYRPMYLSIIYQTKNTIRYC